MDHRVTTYIGATNIISALGFGTNENLEQIAQSQSGITTLDRGVLCAKIDRQRVREEASKRNIGGYTTLEQLMIISIDDVVAQSGVCLSDPDCGLLFSTTKGNIDALCEESPTDPESPYLWAMAQRVASYFGVKRQPLVISNACISGLSAIITASRLIRCGDYKQVVVVGGDLLTDFVVSGFSSFRSLSQNPCRPYDLRRDGLSLGEACGALLLTSEASLSGGCVVEGGAISNDANHISGPSRTGDGLAFVIQNALAQGSADPASISFVNAHGTATLYNDEMEAKAINLCSLQDRPLSSLKPYFGHTLGASGVIEAIVCVEQLKRGVLFGTKGFVESGVSVPICVQASDCHLEMRRCVKTASGFGGCNAAVVLALEQFAQGVTSNAPVVKSEVATCAVRQGSVRLNGKELLACDDPSFDEFIRAAFKSLQSPYLKFYKMDNLCKLGYVTCEFLLHDRSYQAQEVALILSNSSSSLETDLHHQQILDSHPEGGTSPAVFVYTLANIVLGELCIKHRIQGENTCFISRKFDPEWLRRYAGILIDELGYKAVIYGWCEKLGEKYDAQMTIIEKQE